jgi:uncharacterized membrane protein
MDAFERRRLRETFVSICIIAVWTVLSFAAFARLMHRDVPKWLAAAAYAVWFAVSVNLSFRLPCWRPAKLSDDPGPPDDQFPEFE